MCSAEPCDINTATPSRAPGTDLRVLINNAAVDSGWNQ